MLVERRTESINESAGTAEQKFGTNLTKPKIIFCLILNFDDHNSYLFHMNIKIIKYNATGKQNKIFSSEWIVWV